MSQKLHNTILFRAGCCLLAVFCLWLLIGCDGVAGKKPPSLTQTVSLGGSGTILFPAGSQQKIKEDKPHFVAFGPMIMSHTEGAHLVAKGFTYEAACLWIDDNRGELDIFRLGLHDFANPFGCRIHETLADKTKVYEMIGMSRDNAPQSVRIVTAPDGRNYISFFKYKESTIPSAAQIEHEKKFHHSLKVNGRLIEDTLNDEADELYALRTAPPEKPVKIANQEPEKTPDSFMGNEPVVSSTGDEGIVGFESTPESEQNSRTPPPTVTIDDTKLGNSTDGTEFSEKTPNNGVLVGFAVTFDAFDCVESVQPLYRSLTGTGQKRGAVYGNAMSEPKPVFAPAGYAVGGLNGRSGSAVDGFELVCMKIMPDGSLDPTDTMTLPWVGNNDPGGRRTKIDGEGKPVTGIKGYARDHVSSLELVF